MAMSSAAPAISIAFTPSSGSRTSPPTTTPTIEPSVFQA